jgi:anti-sigma-K factor RskA
MSTPQTSPCPYELWDGSYVIGALSPAERREYESHLDGCLTCSRSVRDLAGLPGLLGRIGPEVFESAVEEPVPDTLMPRLARETRRRDRRRTWWTAGVAAAAAAVVTVGGTLAIDHSLSGTPEAGHHITSVAPLVFHPIPSVSADPMRARVALTSVAWGTRVDLECSYPAVQGDYFTGSYVLLVHTRAGRTEKIASWNGLPGKTMQLTAATATSLSKISSIELTTAAGSPVASLGL